MSLSNQMFVTKRNGNLEQVSFDKIIIRLQKLCSMEPKLTNVAYFEVARSVISGLYDKVSTAELDELAAQTCAGKMTEHLEYGRLASRIIISNNHKNTSKDFKHVIELLWNNKDIHGQPAPLINTAIFNISQHPLYMGRIQSTLDYSRDFTYDYFGFKTLEKAYLQRVNKKVVERIQHMIMRVSLGLHLPLDYGLVDTRYSDNEINSFLTLAFETYNLMSQKYFTHATPTLYHSGTQHPQLLSCFLMGVGDSVDGIYQAVADCAKISKWAGGIGAWLSDVRGQNALIRKTNGKSTGLMPMLKVFNETACHINQSGKRNGSFAMYLPPWHIDIFDFLEAKKNNGNEKQRARDLFYALWIPDVFMERIERDEMWSLMDPDTCRGLTKCYGAEFKELYEKYEKTPGFVIKTIPARTLWKEIVSMQIETGTPYLLYGDSANAKSNQKNIGVINSSNLCTEIIEYSDDKEYACCTLASISLPAFVLPFNMDIFRQDSNKLTIYSKTNCIYCKYLKSYLDSYQIHYNLVVLDDDKERQKMYIKLSNMTGEAISTVPQVFIGEEYIGGFTEFMNYTRPKYDYQKLIDVSRVVTRNLNRVIDINYYPVPQTEISNKRHRPIGIGVSGLADVYAQFLCGFDSEEAREINRNIFAAIYYGACLESAELARDFGSYSTFAGSPMSEGKFQFDLWEQSPIQKITKNMAFSLDDINLDWDELRQKTMKGMRNSLLLAPMPTASTAQILGNNEAFEPYTSNLYTRSVLSGDFVLINKYLQDLMLRLGIWTKDIKEAIILNNGSVKDIQGIPKFIQDIFKVSWDISMRAIIDQAADRGIYICQSQSMNLWMAQPTHDKLTSMHFYSWKKGLKTGIYYLRIKAAADAQKFTIDPLKHAELIKKPVPADEICEMCSS